MVARRYRSGISGVAFLGEAALMQLWGLVIRWLGCVTFCLGGLVGRLL